MYRLKQHKDKNKTEKIYNARRLAVLQLDLKVIPYTEHNVKRIFEFYSEIQILTKQTIKGLSSTATSTCVQINIFWMPISLLLVNYHRLSPLLL